MEDTAHGTDIRAEKQSGIRSARYGTATKTGDVEG